MRAILAVTLLLILNIISLNGIAASSLSQPRPLLSPSPSQSPNTEAALTWLAREYSYWSEGFEGDAAPAAYALWLNNSASYYAASSYEYLAGQLDSSSTWFWAYTEADVPGEILLSTAMTQHLSSIQNLPDVSSRLLRLQQPNGGFEGYYDSTLGLVTSSVDTTMALWGLSYAQTIPLENRTAAVAYLLTLQNPDGSFNLTRTTAANQLYSLGPDAVSITSLVTLVLRENGFTITSPIIANSLGFLEKALLSGFGGIGHPYDAALSSLVFMQYYHPHEAVGALTYLIAQQNIDGGFGDISRSISGSNALDTGWAAVALQYGIIEDLTITGPSNRSPTAKFSFEPQDPTNGTAVSFDASSSFDPDGDRLSYSWTFGDGGSSSGQTTTHVYTRSGVFTATLTVTDSGTNPDALSSTAWQNVTVLQPEPPARAATSPSQLTTTIGIPLAVIVAAIVLGYLAVINRRRRLSK